MGAIGSIAQAVTVGAVEGIGISLSLGLPLGNMDNSGRVGNIASSTSIGSSNSGDSSRGKSSNVHRGRRRDTSVASSVGGSIASISGVAKTISGITCVAEASAIAKEVGVSLGSGCSSKEESGLGSKTHLEKAHKKYMKLVLTRNLFMLEFEEFRGAGTLPTVKSEL